jgi:hypothetical protein
LFGFFFQNGAGIRNCTKPLLSIMPGIKVNNRDYQNIKYLVLKYNHGYKKIKYLVIIYNCGYRFFKKPNNCLNNHWVFHETQQFEVFENTQNQRFFESDFFIQILQPGCSLILKILKCLESTVL